MRSYSLIAPAKINLYLEIIGDRPDGYHELVMVLQSIALADEVHIRSIGSDVIRVHCDDSTVPQDEANLAYQAAALMQQQFPDAQAKWGGVEIDIEKHIPIGAGLAGGSADAAAVLVGINLLWQLGLTQLELQDLAAQLGSDIPFCVTGGTALATGRGELLDALPSLPQGHVVLAKYRDLPISTPWAYCAYRQQFGHTYPCGSDDLECRKQQVHSSGMLGAIAQPDIPKIAQLLHNDLEKVVLPAYPQVQHLREQFQAIGSLGTLMSGSGSTVFALVESATQAEQVKAKMRRVIADANLELWVTTFSQVGIQLAPG
jgi:4-diphosphocytidyl-2-C-methyl-D-erythritol kinase